MKVLIIGSGGREHALAWKISQSKKLTKLYCAPGNPGIEEIAECVPLKPSDLHGLLGFVLREKIDLTVVGPEQPLSAGIVDLFEASNLSIFGPSKKAAELEWSKAFAKDFMRRHDIPTAHYRTFSLEQIGDALSYVEQYSFPIVIKADGLAAGKGVTICETREHARSSLEMMMKEKLFGSAGETVVIEEFLHGEEASVFAICNGTDHITLAPAQDHKKVFDDDRGKNTGGMGAYAPAPVVTEKVMQRVKEKIIEPTLSGMMAEGRPFKGCLYCGLIITKDGPQVIEYNCRFGDPETQVVLPLYNGDLLELLSAASYGDLSGIEQPSHVGTAACVVLASGGYPDDYRVGFPINGLPDVKKLPGVLVFHAGTKREGGNIVTAGGRVLGVTAWEEGGALRPAIDRAYRAARLLSFNEMHYRRDIGMKAFAHEAHV